jgi:hypothetical protein
VLTESRHTICKLYSNASNELASVAYVSATLYEEEASPVITARSFHITRTSSRSSARILTSRFVHPYKQLSIFTSTFIRERIVRLLLSRERTMRLPSTSRLGMWALRRLSGVCSSAQCTRSSPQFSILQSTFLGSIRSALRPTSCPSKSRTGPQMPVRH